MAWFGEPHTRLKEIDSFTEPEPCVDWAFIYDCGLEIVVSFYFGNNFVKICSDLPEIDHIFRHLENAIKIFRQALTFSTSESLYTVK